MRDGKVAKKVSAPIAATSVFWVLEKPGLTPATLLCSTGGKSGRRIVKTPGFICITVKPMLANGWQRGRK